MRTGTALSGTLLLGATLLNNSINQAGAMADELQEREEALRGLICAHERVVRAMLSRVEFDHHAVEDLTADTFALAFYRLDQLLTLGLAQQRRWLLTTASYLAANHGRRQATYRRAVDRWAREPLDAQLPGPEVVVLEAAQSQENADRSAALRAALASLPERHREVLVLDAVGHDGPAIGQRLNISPGAARKRLMLARIALREAYADQVVPESEPEAFR